MFKTVLTVVDDLDAAKAVWTALLGDPTNDSPYYVGWTDGDHEVGLTPTQDPADKGSVAYWHTSDIEGAIDLKDTVEGASGATPRRPA